MFCFENLWIFGENRKNEKLENLEFLGSYAAAWDASPRRGQGAKNGTPRVHHGVATLRCGKGLCRSIANVHSEHISNFCFRTPRNRSLNKDKTK